MRRRKDQLPKDVINSENWLEISRALAEVGPVFCDELAWDIFLLISEAPLRPSSISPLIDCEGKEAMDELASKLANQFIGILKARDIKEMQHVLQAFKLAVDRSNRPQAYNRTMVLAATHEIESELNDLPSSGQTLLEFLRKHYPNIDEGYIRQIRRRLVKVRRPGRPSKRSSKSGAKPES
jgi:hypothetical protein